jgi:hypothetical protein
VNIRRFVALASVVVTTAFAADAPQSYVGAKALWEKNKSRAEYQTYSAEFAQFNNHFHLDEKDGCYGLAPGPVNLMLVIVHKEGDEFALVESALSDVDNAKAQCFRRTYGGIRTKTPPFLPFVLQMGMG